MKLSISNIAWRADEEEAVADLMGEMGLEGIEIALTKVWPFPLSVSASDLQGYREFWLRRGIQIVAMQSLLFGRPDLTIFDTEEKRRETRDYLVGMIRIGGRLGAKTLVFGSPKNRRVGTLSLSEIERIALPFFYDLGQVAMEEGVTFCIEPNPTAYECDFIITSREGRDLVARVNSKGFGLHLDAAGMTLSGEPIEPSIESVFPAIKHFHASEVNLAPVGSGSVNHPRFASILNRLGYRNWVSIEMRAADRAGNLAQVKASVSWIASIYGETKPSESGFV